MSGLLRLRRNEKGQALVEFALVASILIMLVLGIVEFGFIYNRKITINSAAREGARVGATLREMNDVQKKDKIFKAIEKAVNPSGLTVTKDDIGVTPEDDDIIVVISVEIEPVVGLFVPDTITLSSTARMRRE